MSNASPDELELARQLLARELSACLGEPPDASSHDAERTRVATCGVRVLQRLHDHLTRWFGPDGCSALFARALDRTRPNHPVLNQLRRDASGEYRLDGAAGATSADGAPLLREAFAALIATIIAQLARLVGEDMTTQMIDQIYPETLRDVSRAKHERVAE